MNERQSDLRGIKDGWYAMERGWCARFWSVLQPCDLPIPGFFSSHPGRTPQRCGSRRSRKQATPRVTSYVRPRAIDRLVRSPTARLPERNQPPAAFVPQHQPHAAQALQQRQPADVAKLGMVAQHARQPVVGDPAAQMVHVMHADIGGEPAQDARQVVVRAAVQRRLVQVPARCRAQNVSSNWCWT